MFSDEPEYTTASWTIYTPCPACRHDVVVGYSHIACKGGSRLDNLSNSQKGQYLINGYAYKIHWCEECQAGIYVEATKGIGCIEAASTILAWINAGRVPITVAVGSGWPATWGKTPLGDFQIILESLYLTQDPRLNDLISRQLSESSILWTRISPEVWRPISRLRRRAKWKQVHIRNNSVQFESFYQSLEIACPTPPSLNMVVAACERSRGNP